MSARVTTAVMLSASLVVACGDGAKETKTEVGTPAATVEPAKVESTKPESTTAPTVTPVTAAPGTPRKNAETRLRDSLTLPIGMVDSNGKRVPLPKRP